MLALLINRQIFSLQGVSIALLAILIHQPLSLLLPGFWLSFVAVIILILASKIFSTPLKALLLTQLIISLILIPLTASFFGEISLISPLINLFAIPWTSLMIMPPLLLGTLLLMIHTPTAKVFIAIADHSIDLLTQVIHLGAQIPYASVKTKQLPLLISLIITVCVLWILYLIPRFPLFRSDYPDLATRCITFYQRLYYPIKRLKMITITTTITVMLRIVLSIFVLLTIFFYLKPFLSPKRSPADHEALPDIEIENHNNSDIIDLYLLPVGEGLSLLFHSKALTFLFDTGNRFRNFDAGRQVVLPTLQSLNIKNLDQIFLSLQNQQHIGGTRSIRNKFPQTQITAHPKLLWLIHDAQNCQQYHYQSSTINIQPIKEIHSSCAFHITLFKTISLYLFSDITELEWQHFLQKNDLSQQKAFTHQILLFPHQGRRNYQTDLLFNSENRVSNTTFNTILFSTKTPALHLQQTLQDHPFTETYNAYYGTIHLSIFHKNAKSFSKLRIQNYADHARYWWLKP